MGRLSVRRNLCEGHIGTPKGGRFRAGCHGEDAVTVGLGVLGVLGSILAVVGSSRDS